MKTTIAPALFCAFLLSASAGENRPQPWSSVEFHVPQEEGEAVVNIEGTEALSKLVLTIGGTPQEVPAEELSDIDLPRLHTAQLNFGSGLHGKYVEGEEPIPHAVITMEFGSESKHGGYATVKFIFFEGKYQVRNESVRKSETVWLEYRKEVGGNIVEVGTTNRPPPGTKAPAGFGLEEE